MDRASHDRTSGAPDAEAFRGIVEQYQDRIFRLVVSVLGPYSDADAEDVTQDVFITAYNKLGQFRGDASIGTWLYRIARNHALNRKRRARYCVPHLQIETVAGEMAAQSDDPLLYEEREHLARCLERLPDTYRTAFYMHYWMGSTVEEVAEAIGAAPGTVKSYLSRGRDRLRSCLNKLEETR